jgi:hypothetical protein
MIYRVEGDMLRRVARVGSLPLAAFLDVVPLARDVTVGRATLDRNVTLWGL